MVKVKGKHHKQIKSLMQNYDAISGIKGSIERTLLISHSKEYVREIMQDIDVLIKYAINTGTCLARNKYDEETKTSIWKSDKKEGRKYE